MGARQSAIRANGILVGGLGSQPGIQLATSSLVTLSYLSRAVSSSSRQETTSDLRRSRARRSRSVMPPQTPNSIRLSSASARHSVRTGQPRQISLARFCAAPWTKSSSGSVPLHAARAVQSVIHMWPTPPDRHGPEGRHADGVLPRVQGQAFSRLFPLWVLRESNLRKIRG